MIHLKYRLDRLLDELTMKIAWALPKRLVKWCYIRVLANSTTGKWEHQEVPRISAMTAIKRWDCCGAVNRTNKLLVCDMTPDHDGDHSGAAIMFPEQNNKVTRHYWMWDVNRSRETVEEVMV